MSNSYYHRIDEQTWQPTEHVQGAWNEHEQHMAPVAGLLAHALQAHEPRPDLQTARLSYEILGLMPLEPTTITCRTVRPGRTIELVEAVMTTASAPERPVVRATAWRLASSDTSTVAGNLPDPIPGPDELGPGDRLAAWPGGFIRSLQARLDEPSPGRRFCWLTSPVSLLPAQPDGSPAAGPVAEFVRLVDSANGIAAQLDPYQWIFPNTDLTIHLWRTPVGPDVGFDTMATIGPDGVGCTQTVLHDVQGPVGRATQALTVRRRPSR